ncbi:MAG: tRNA(His) guanylyltransferase Thg1 family protein [Planctomycetaceae bacterium]
MISTRRCGLETAADLCVLPSMLYGRRLDGRSFTRLTKDLCQFEAPFDLRFRDLMVSTTESLMTAVSALYAYTESDEDFAVVRSG